MKQALPIIPGMTVEIKLTNYGEQKKKQLAYDRSEYISREWWLGR